MILTLNGKQELIDRPLSLDALVAAKGLCHDKIVVEHNFSIISKEDWAKIMLKDQDMIEIISFVGGG
ncbi:MAG: thiamine biosynthesis protein ThiS [Omnitrophica bacterium RIFOXYB12_FULL_50_7]|nr:MAG: thiamine biosynthesis protein ThiS [Omnitrophica bacterium RIFOXYB12_FULL_50_7]